MGAAELKLDIFRMVDQLPESELQKLYGMIMHLADPDAVPWDTLSDDEKAAIEKGLAQLDQGKGKPHSEVMAKFRERYHSRANQTGRSSGRL